MFDRATEIERYVECYKDPSYAMGFRRLLRAKEVLESLKHLALLPAAELGVPGLLLDIGAGRGELREIAEECGFRYFGADPATGMSQLKALRTSVDMYNTIVNEWDAKFNRIWDHPATNLAWRDKHFDVVCCLDVLEHLIPEDVEPALREMDRVCKGTLFLTANSDSSIGPDGKDLHISKRPETEWHQLFVDVFAGRNVENIGMVGVSPGWLIRCN